MIVLNRGDRVASGMRGRTRRRWRLWSEGLLVAVVAGAMVAGNTDFNSPPRFDGAGYAVLAEALRTGSGYRAIDHPDAPLHAHFPPGYPAALGLLWSVTGRSARSAHLFSTACTVAATWLAWNFYRRLYPRRVAFLLGLALATNWAWARSGGAIGSEPLFVLLELASLLAADRARRRGSLRHGAILGMLLGLATLTRHVGVMLTFAVLIDRVGKGRWRVAAVVALVNGLLIAPWIAWVAWVGKGTQVELIHGSGLIDRVGAQAMFYAGRIPDALAAPLVELGTVFAPRFAGLAIAWGLLGSSVVVLGWLLGLRSSRRRLAAIVPMATLALLLVWPFTEAGRFLVPLVPFLLAGAVEGLAAIGLFARRSLDIRGNQATTGLGGPKRRAHSRPRPRTLAAGLLLLAAVPYSMYAVVTRKADRVEGAHRDYDEALRWIAGRSGHPGPLLTRQAGEAFWLSGRRAIDPPDDPKAIAERIERYRVAYLIDDRDRYARDQTSPIGRFIASHPEAARAVWRSGGVTVFEVRRDRPH